LTPFLPIFTKNTIFYHFLSFLPIFASGSIFSKKHVFCSQTGFLTFLKKMIKTGKNAFLPLFLSGAFFHSFQQLAFFNPPTKTEGRGGSIPKIIPKNRFFEKNDFFGIFFDPQKGCHFCDSLFSFFRKHPSNNDCRH
jgi:hypothetical protein